MDSMEKLSFGFLTGVIKSTLCACASFGVVAGVTCVEELDADGGDIRLACHSDKGA